MSDHHQTAKQALKDNFRDYFKPSSYHVNFRLHDIRDLQNFSLFDLYILDRDCTLQGYHAKTRVPEFEKTLKAIGQKSELVSNSSYDEFLRIRDIFGDIMPVSKLVKLYGTGSPYLLRFTDGKLSIFLIDRPVITDGTSILLQGDKLLGKIEYNYKKPNPKIIEAVININKVKERVPKNPRILMVGDRYLTDIVAGNLRY